MAEKQNIPEIRFEGFTDPWEQRKFSEIVDVCSGRDYKHLNEGPIPVYGTGGYMTSVCEALSHNRDAVGIGRKGTIDKPYLLKAPFWTVDTLFYAIPKPDINLEFALCSFLNVDWKSKDESTGLPSLSKEAINETVLRVPNAVEQNHLGSFFTDIDSLITLHQRKYDKLCTVKKSMLDKMFPKPGETEPEIRFEGFTDPWEQRKLGELCTISKGHGYSKADIRDDGTPLILYGRLYTQYESRIENVDTFAVEQEGSLLSKGNEVIVPASGETAEDIAVASSVRRSGIIFGGDLNVVTPASRLDPDYTALAITYSKAHDDLARRAQGKSVVHVHGNDIAEVEIPYPSESEQKRISTTVLTLDNLITLHQRKLELLRNIKKSLLDRMFV